MKIKTFKKYLSEQEYDNAENKEKEQEEAAETIDDNKLNVIKTLRDGYVMGDFRDEDEFLQQIKIDTGMDFESFDDVKEFLYDAKNAGHKRNRKNRGASTTPQGGSMSANMF